MRTAPKYGKAMQAQLHGLHQKTALQMVGVQVGEGFQPEEVMGRMNRVREGKEIVDGEK